MFNPTSADSKLVVLLYSRPPEHKAKLFAHIAVIIYFWLFETESKGHLIKRLAEKRNQRFV